MRIVLFVNGNYNADPKADGCTVVQTWFSHGNFLVMKYAIMGVWQQASRLGNYDAEQCLVL
jgi:hypothetical protein